VGNSVRLPSQIDLENRQTLMVIRHIVPSPPGDDNLISSVGRSSLGG
jgi:hypothetical protein